MYWKYKKISDKEKIPSDLRASFVNWQYPKIPTTKPTIYGWRVFGYDEKNPKKL